MDVVNYHERKNLCPQWPHCADGVRMIDELEKKEQALSQRLAELEASAVAHDPSTVDTTSPDDRHTRSIAASSPATREGASIRYSYMCLQFGSIG